jgi:hypothetical protein
MLEKVKKNAGPILYTIVVVFSIWFFIWFGALNPSDMF